MNPSEAINDAQAWDALTAGERGDAAQSIVEAMPGLKLDWIERYQLGEAAHVVAKFEFRGREFALIPGGSARLGMGVDDLSRLTPAHRAEWRGTEEDWGISIEEFVQQTMGPPRQFEAAPFLLEVAPQQVGIRPLSDAEVEEIARSDPGRPRAATDVPRVRTFRMTRTADGGLRGTEETPWSHTQASAAAAEQGCRLPTSDEWEYACRGGAVGIFRWGDECPVEELPTEEMDFDLHRRWNAFGLKMPADPYNYEAVQEPGVMRGGDGGTTICGGMGIMAGWLPLASGFIHRCCEDPAERHYRMHLRLAISLRGVL